MAERPQGFEYKHVECPQIPVLVDLVTNDHAKFYWELTGTQTVVATESHLESGDYNPDNLYSVTTTERFVAIDFKRSTDIQDLDKIKQVERRYFETCASLNNLGASPLDNYASAPPKDVNYLIVIGLAMFFCVVPGILYYKWKDKKHKESVTKWIEVKTSLDRLLVDNKEILNIAN